MKSKPVQVASIYTFSLNSYLSLATSQQTEKRGSLNENAECYKPGGVLNLMVCSFYLRRQSWEGIHTRHDCSPAVVLVGVTGFILLCSKMVIQSSPRILRVKHNGRLFIKVFFVKTKLWHVHGYALVCALCMTKAWITLRCGQGPLKTQRLDNHSCYTFLLSILSLPLRMHA